MSKMEWTRDWPTEPGMYWFYGFRYGRVSFGTEKERVLMLVEAHKISSGFSYIANGQFMYKSEPEDSWFIEVILPKFPEGN